GPGRAMLPPSAPAGSPRTARRDAARAPPGRPCSSSAICLQRNGGTAHPHPLSRQREMTDPTWYGARLMSPPGKLGAGSAMAAYVALLFGMLVIGAPAQQRGIVSGLWITEALAIALPAALVLGFAGIRFAPWLGLRPLSLRHALVAAAVAAVGFSGLMEIGILLGALRWWSGSLWAAMIGHAVNNGIAGGAFLLGWEDPDVPPPAWVLALGATLFILGLWELARLLRRSVP